MKPSVLFISGREAGYIRNHVLLSALQEQFRVTVLTANVSSTVIRTAAGLARFIARRPLYDVCFVGFYGQPLAIALSALQDKPIILDAYVSTYDTLCEDRRIFSSRSSAGRLAFWLDQRGCQAAAHVVTDTYAHAEYFAATFGVPAGKLEPVYIGCDEQLFFPREEISPHLGHLEVFYYGAFLPLHGTEVIVQAAALLRDRPEIHFAIGGDGPLRPAVERLIGEHDLANIKLVGWIPIEQLPTHIAAASVCLGGHFSAVPKAARVISTKTFQFIAMARPTIVGDNAATRELFVPGEHVMSVPMNDPSALAETIALLADDATLRHRVAAGGRLLFQERLTISAIGTQLSTIIEQALA